MCVCVYERARRGGRGGPRKCNRAIEQDMNHGAGNGTCQEYKEGYFEETHSAPNDSVSSTAVNVKEC